MRHFDERWWLWRLKAWVAVIFTLIFTLGFLHSLIRSLIRYFFILLILLFPCVVYALTVQVCSPLILVSWSNCMNPYADRSCPAGQYPFNLFQGYDPAYPPSICGGTSSNVIQYYCCQNCFQCPDGSQVCDGTACYVPLPVPGTGATGGIGGTGPAGGTGGTGAVYTGNPTIDGLSAYNIDSSASLSPTSTIDASVSSFAGVVATSPPTISLPVTPVVTSVVPMIASAASGGFQSVTPELSTYTNSQYSLCDCKQVLSDFFASVRNSSLFNLVNFSGLNVSGGSSSFTYDLGSYGNQTLDFSHHAAAYSIVASILFFLASLISIRIIVLKR